MRGSGVGGGGMSAQPTSRRAMLQGAAILTAVPVAALGGVPVSGVVGEPEPVEAETPIVRLFRRWETAQAEETQAHRELRSLPLLTIFARDEIYATLGERRLDIEAAILAEPATDLRDSAIKVLVNSGEGCFALDDVLTLECAQLAGRHTAKLPGCLFEKGV